MANNAELAEMFEMTAKLIEVSGGDSFRAIAHSKVARIIEASTVDFIALAAHADARKQLIALDGIGIKIADKIIEYASTGKMHDLIELRAAVPAGLLPLMTIQGLGPKTINVLWKQGGVTDLASLNAIIDSGAILSLPRMGAKSVEKLKASIAIMDQANLRLALGPARELADSLVSQLAKLTAVPAGQIAFAGSLRRGRDTVGDIDILLATDSPDVAAKASRGFVTLPGVRTILAEGASKCSVRMAVKLGDKWAAAADNIDAAADSADLADPANLTDPAERTVQVDLRIVPVRSFGAALMYFTGSKEFNVKLRSRALTMGLTLNEYGLFPEDAQDTPPQTRGIAPVAGQHERDIFDALKLAEVVPEQREDTGEVEAAAAGFTAGKALPRLVELADIRAELHSHTTASDGVLSIAQLATEALARGMRTLAVTDHSQSQPIARGLKPDRLLAHIAAVHAERANFPGLLLLAGSEVDILSNGSLDYSDEVLAKLDWVVGSPHNALGQDPDVATARLIRAMESGKVHVLGHPTGRLVLRRRGLEPDMAKVIAAAVRYEVALEINAHWMRLDLRDRDVRWAVDAGALIAINCDVHHPDDFDNLRYGISTARRGWLTPDRCINTWSSEKIDAWRRKKR